jgi:hypothetical protein
LAIWMLKEGWETLQAFAAAVKRPVWATARK